jgi:hypothetical protein
MSSSFCSGSLLGKWMTGVVDRESLKRRLAKLAKGDEKGRSLDLLWLSGDVAGAVSPK